MNRSGNWLVWSVLLACAVLIFGMFAWITRRALDSENERLTVEASALRTERVRLSLNRMDNIGTDLLVSENLRPPMHYRAFFSPANIVTNDLRGVEEGVVLQVSPIMRNSGEFIDLHFEIQPDGKIFSPQVPRVDQRERAWSGGLENALIDKMSRRLANLNNVVPTREEIARVFHQGSPDQLATAERERAEEASVWIADNASAIAPQSKKFGEVYQNNLNISEEKSRTDSFNKRVNRALQNSRSNQVPLSPSKQDKAGKTKGKLQDDQAKSKRGPEGPTVGMTRPTVSPNGILSVSPFMPLWHGHQLFYLREVRRLRSVTYQGIWIARSALEKALVAEVPTDLGGTKLVRSDQAPQESHRLVSLPWVLDVAPLPPLEEVGWTPLRKTLIAGWSAAVLAMIALFLLLRGVMKLSERRAAFVSSVTHELRTPLTTFRLYSEMLSEDMITDEAKKQEYLRTMLGESERLNHLVENVLSYARIERGNARSKFEKLAVADLIERMRSVLQRRVDQENAALSIELANDLGEVETDITAVEQILFNLIDNACKYGLPDTVDEGETGHIVLNVSRLPRGLVFEVSDEGRGIARSEKRRLFRAFHKSALDAAHDKPGVGLGLALCRRLAKALGGDLRLGSKRAKGASFELVIPG